MGTSSPVLGEGKDEDLDQYHKCLDLILTKGTTQQKKLAIGMLIVESDEIKEREKKRVEQNG